jgi:hypothetical protein
MGNVIRFEAIGPGVLSVEEREFEDKGPSQVDLDAIYNVLEIGGSPFCVILMGWIGDDSLILVGDDEALLKPENKYCTFVRPTDGHQCAGPIVVMRQSGSPGSEEDYWAPLTDDQVEAVKTALTLDGPEYTPWGFGIVGPEAR